MSKRVLAMALAILAFFIFVGSPFQQPAQAIAIEGSLIAIIIAALAAMGITFTTTGAFDNLESYVTSLMFDCAADYNTTVENQLKGAQTGSNAFGQIVMNNRLVLYLDTFAKWLSAHFSLSNNASYDVVIPGVALGNLHGYSVPITLIGDNNISVYTVEGVNNTGDVAIFFEKPTGSGSWSVRGISRGTGSIKRTEIYSNGTVFESTVALDATRNGWHWNYPQAFGITPTQYDDGNVLFAYYQSEIMQALNTYDEVTVTPYGVIVNTGDIEYPTENDNYSAGDGAVLDLDNPWGLDYDETTNTIPGEYEGAQIDYQTEQEIQEQVTDTPAQSISENASDYQSPGLQSVFPFCIPFDIYAFFECLAADPEAPSFVWRFYIPGICDEDLEIDLAAFDSAARILRTMELLLFIVGLAFVTRDKFLRG